MTLPPAAAGVTQADIEWARSFLAEAQRKASAQPGQPAAAPSPAPPAPPDAFQVLAQQLQVQSDYVRQLAEWAQRVHAQQQEDRAELQKHFDETRAVLDAVLDRLTTPSPTTQPDKELDQNDEPV